MSIKKIKVIMQLETEVAVNFINDKGDNDTPPYFEAIIESVNYHDVFNQIQAHVTECGEDYYEDNK